MDTIGTLVLAIIGGGGLIGALIAVIKLRPETRHMTVELVHKAASIQSALIEDLRKEMDRMGELLSDLQNDLLREIAETGRLRGEVERLGAHIEEVEEDRDRLRAERDELRARVVVLERKVDELRP